LFLHFGVKNKQNFLIAKVTVNPLPKPNYIPFSKSKFQEQ